MSDSADIPLRLPGWLTGSLDLSGSVRTQSLTMSSRDEQLAQTTARDPALMLRVSSGDGDALAALLHHYGTPVFSCLLRRVKPREAAEDLYQETWLRVVQRAATFRPGQRALPWIYSIAINLAADHYRHEQSTKRGGHLEHISLHDAPEALHVAATASASDLSPTSYSPALPTDLESAVAALPEPFRETVRLRYFEELTTGETAQALGCAEGTVKSRLARGLALLQQRMKSLRFEQGAQQ